MRFIILYVILLIAGCKESSHSESAEEPKEIASANLLLEVLKAQEKVTFFSTRDGPHIEYRCSCMLQFMENSKVIFSSYAFNFGDYNGVYTLKGESIEITLEDPTYFFQGEYNGEKFPTLVLKKENGVLLLNRKDGKNDFDEHWNVYPDPDNQLPPIFPLTTRVK